MSVLSVFKSDYNRGHFWKDLIAGLSVLILLIPQGLAYALLAGFPPITGLYAGVVALLIYPFFASSRQLSVGPVALTAIILFAGLVPFAEPFSEEYIRLGLLVGLISGILQILLASFRLGIIINFLSNPVINGFISAAAIIICVNQIHGLLGLDIARQGNIILDSIAIIKNLGEIHWLTTAIGMASIVLLILLKRWNRKIPRALIVFALGTLITFFFKWDNQGVDVIGSLPSGLPQVKWFTFSFADVKSVLPLSIIVALISFIDSSALAKKLLAAKQDHRLKPNHELLGLGFAKVVGSFFYAFPTSGSFGRSAVNHDSEAHSQVSSWITAILLILVLLFLAPLFYYTPKALLAAMIIAATFKLIDIRSMIETFKYDRRDFYSMIACFFLTLLVGIQEGILAGVLISIGLILYRTMRPHYAVLGKLQKENVYRNINRFSDAAFDDDVLIFRYDDDLYFANADYFYETITDKISENPGTKLFVFDMSAISLIDSTGFDTLVLLCETLKNSGVELVTSGMKGPVRDLFNQDKYAGIIPESKRFMSIDKAIESYSMKNLNSTL